MTADFRFITRRPAIRMYLRPVALAMDWPNGLPTPGGPTRLRIGPLILFTRL